MTAATLFSILLWLAPSSQAQIDPDATVRKLQAERSAKISAAIKANKSADFARIDRELVEAAQRSLKGIERSAIKPPDALRWSELFGLAERYEDAHRLIESYLALEIKPAERFQAELALCSNAVKRNDGNTIFQTLTKATPPNPSQAIWLGSITGGTFHHWIRESNGPEGALQIVQRIKSFLPAGPFKTDQERKDAGWAKRQIADCEATYLSEVGRRKEALAVLDHAIRTLDKDVFRVAELQQSRDRIAMLGQPAPGLSPVAMHGNFGSLASLKGKVVLLEFTAHWCHACHAALPSIRKLAKEFEGQAFQVIAVTTYYGHFLAERSKEKDMPRDEEFAKMPKLMEELGISWPMVYVERLDLKAWGVSGIPEFVVLDKSGVVQWVDLGFSEGKFSRLSAKIRSLLLAE